MRDLASHDPHISRDISTVERVLKRSGSSKRARNLRTRLEYASFKVNNGWMDRNLTEVSELYLRQQIVKKQANSSSVGQPNMSHIKGGILPNFDQIMHPALPPANDHQSMALARTGNATVNDRSDISRDSSPEIAAAELILSFTRSPSPYRLGNSPSIPDSQLSDASSPNYRASPLGDGHSNISARSEVLRHKDHRPSTSSGPSSESCNQQQQFPYGKESFGLSLIAGAVSEL